MVSPVAAREGHRVLLAGTEIGLAFETFVRGPKYRQYWCGDVLKLNDSSKDADRDCLCPIVRVEFLHDVLEMCFHRLFRDEELFSDVAVAIVSGKLTQDVNFTRSKLFITVVFSQIRGYLGWNPLLSSMDLPNYIHQFIRRRRLQNVSASSSLKRPLNFRATGKGRQNDEMRSSIFRPYRNHRVDAAHI